MKTISKATLIIGALLASNMALAGDHERTAKHDRDRDRAHLEDGKRYYNQSYAQNYKQNYGKRHKRGNKHYVNDVVRLDIPVHLRGNDKIHLRRAINNHYRINLDHYRLKKVVVHNKGRRTAVAKLKVGYDRGNVQYLNRGANHIRAPRHSNGRWVLGVQDARIDHVRVVLEPKPQWAHHDGRRDLQRPWFKGGYPRW